MPTSKPGSENWRTLLPEALGLLRDAERHVGHAIEWSIGGGTSLRLRYEHRDSHDIDVFIRDPQLLGIVSPRLNDRTATLVAGYTEQSNFLKLNTPAGDIDFIVAAPLTVPGVEERVLGGVDIRIDTPAEVVAKKLLYRASGLRPRDLVGAAVVLAKEPGADAAVARIVAGKYDILSERIPALLERLAEPNAAQRFALLPAGEPYLARAGEILSAFLETVRLERR
jgi:hypothetical protein